MVYTGWTVKLRFCPIKKCNLSVQNDKKFIQCIWKHQSRLQNWWYENFIVYDICSRWKRNRIALNDRWNHFLDTYSSNSILIMRKDYSEEPVYDISSLFADVGGAAGLALGMSLATLIGEWLESVSWKNPFVNFRRYWIHLIQTDWCNQTQDNHICQLVERLSKWVPFLSKQ